jgi:hypothetical protein
MHSRREHDVPGQPLDAAFDAEVGRGWALAHSAQEDEAIALFGALVERYPDEPRAHVE